MTENKVHELFYELFGENCDRAYNNPGKAIGYYEGAWEMAQKVIENLEPDFELETTPNGQIFRKLRSIASTDYFNDKGKEVSTQRTRQASTHHIDGSDLKL